MADIGMGKSQRYQAAVDGHLCRHASLELSEKVHGKGRPEPEYRPNAFLPTDSWGGLAVTLL